MDSFKKWVDDLGKGLRILFAILVPELYFVYRLFVLIQDKAKNKDRLTYFILNVIPIVFLVVYVLDIIAAFKGEPVTLEFKKKEKKQDKKQVEEKPEEEKKAEQ